MRPGSDSIASIRQLSLAEWMYRRLGHGEGIQVEVCDGLCVAKLQLRGALRQECVRQLHRRPLSRSGVALGAHERRG